MRGWVCVGVGCNGSDLKSAVTDPMQQLSAALGSALHACLGANTQEKAL